MACTARSRGTRTAPLLPPFVTVVQPNPPFNAVTDNDPCGYTAISTAGGTSYAADSLCLFHLIFKYGQKAIGPPYT